MYDTLAVFNALEFAISGIFMRIWRSVKGACVWNLVCYYKYYKFVSLYSKTCLIKPIFDNLLQVDHKVVENNNLNFTLVSAALGLAA